MVQLRVPRLANGETPPLVSVWNVCKLLALGETVAYSATGKFMLHRELQAFKDLGHQQRVMNVCTEAGRFN